MISRQLVLLLSALLVASTIPSSHCYRITLQRLDYETGSDENNNEAPQEVSNEVVSDLPVLTPVEQDADETDVVKRDTDAESNNELDVIDNTVNVNNLDLELPAEDQEEDDDDEGVDEAPAEAASVSNPDSDPVQVTNELPTGPGPLTFACRINFLIYDPTCASDGNTYASRYELACAQQEDPSLDRVSCAGEADQAEDEDRFVDNVVSRVARWRTM